MCRNIRTLHNFEPPATEEEIQAAALQYVRKVSGYNKPPRVNQEIFEQAVEDLAQFTRELLASLEPTAPPKNREVEVEKRRAAFRQRQR